MPADAPRLRLWSLQEDVRFVAGARPDQLTVSTRWGDIRVDDVGPTEREALRRMSLGPVSLENVLPARERVSPGEDRDAEAAVATAWARLDRVLSRLGGCVVHSLGLPDGRPALSVMPVSPRATFRLEDVDPTRPVRLSRFAVLRAGAGGEPEVESPLARHRVVLHRPVAGSVVAALGSPTSVATLVSELTVPEPLLADIVAFLVSAGMVVLGEPSGPPGLPGPTRFAEDTDPSLGSWSPPDLLFHSESRQARPPGWLPPGAPPAPGPPSPAAKPVPRGRRFPLHRPVLADVAAADPPLTDVIERWLSLGPAAQQPPSAPQLGELLFRAARASLEELEMYLTVDRCAGLPRGIFYYARQEHALVLLSTSETDLADLLDAAKAEARAPQRPPVLVTVTARMAEPSRPPGARYAAVLRHVGALQQTLWLVAAAMGVESRALSVGETDTTAAALRLDWPAEVSVGEFAIGVRG